MAMPSTTERVPFNTSQAVNQKIERQTERNIAYYAAHPQLIDGRLEELNREWDTERTLEANAASVTMASVALGLLVSRKWLLLPALVGGFLMQHAVQGWCPPLPLLRRMGVRTQTEIEKERYALKALRGDFNQLEAAQAGGDVTQVTERVLHAVK